MLILKYQELKERFMNELIIKNLALALEGNR